MTLRESVVEAMAQAIYGCDDWDELHPDDKARIGHPLCECRVAIWREGAERALDAALDVLGKVFDLENARPFSIAEEDALAIQRLSKALRAGKGSE